MQGGCQCGAIRYQVSGAPLVVAICHCTMCRRANAAPAVAWAMYEQSQVTFSGRASYIPGLIDLTVGSLDHPEEISPQLHYWGSTRLPWVRFADELPRHAEFPPFGDDK